MRRNPFQKKVMDEDGLAGEARSVEAVMTDVGYSGRLCLYTFLQEHPLRFIIIIFECIL